MKTLAFFVIIYVVFTTTKYKKQNSYPQPVHAILAYFIKN